MTSPSVAATSLNRPALFVVAVFISASLVFLVEPMVGKLLLPLLGGSPAVWTTSMAFFQGGLLVGYGYAHWLQRFAFRRQAIIHAAVLIAAALALPLRVNGFGPPSAGHPNLWLVGTLILSVGAPFAVLSATAPLVQAWYARTLGSDGREPYGLYAASNLGSLLALLAYPLLVEPTFTLTGQRFGWSAGYLAFALMMLSLGFLAAPAGSAAGAPAVARPDAGLWRRRVEWVALAAAPSSLMLGLTAFIATDVASAPFLWVLPLTLYLLTFVIAFQPKPAIRPSLALMAQAAVLPACAFFAYLRPNIGLQLLLQCLGFFLSALVCHQRLVERRPQSERLTDFYFCMSLGGVIGGAFNAFVAPVAFNDVIEYPAVLALIVLARPAVASRPRPLEWAGLLLGVATVAAFAAGRQSWGGAIAHVPAGVFIVAIVLSGLGLRARPLGLFVVVGALLLVAHAVVQSDISSQRSFFGVLKQRQEQRAALGGPVKVLMHGTTVHGAQAESPLHRCLPLTYYAPETTIGSTFAKALAARPAGASIGVVGLGAGAVATYTRPGDRLTFYEIDPLVVRIAARTGQFSYTTTCAHGEIDYVVGDARLSLEKVAPQRFDLLLVDAFSSDAVPAHLLTVEALKLYLSRINPQGLVVLHLSNQHMDLTGPALAAAAALGAPAAHVEFRPTPEAVGRMASAEQVVLVARNTAALAPYVSGAVASRPSAGKPWTDDYTNILGAILAHFRAPQGKAG